MFLPLMNPYAAQISFLFFLFFLLCDLCASVPSALILDFFFPFLRR